MSRYEFLTEELRSETLNSLEETKNKMKQYNYPQAFISAIEIEQKLVRGLPEGMLVPIRE